VTLPRASGKSKNGEKQRAPFEPADVVKLLQMAEGEDDKQLADLISLGMWSGARIEELCSLKVEQVKGNADHFDIQDAKTPAGIRQDAVGGHATLIPACHSTGSKRAMLATKYEPSTSANSRTTKLYLTPATVRAPR
jgi:integrase